MSDQPLNPAQRELEAALGALRPATISIDRDRLLFEAGRRSMRRPLLAWRGAAAALAASLCLSLGLAGLRSASNPSVAHAPAPPATPRAVAHLEEPIAPWTPASDVQPGDSDSSASLASYVRLRDAVARNGDLAPRKSPVARGPASRDPSVDADARRLGGASGLHWTLEHSSQRGAL